MAISWCNSGSYAVLSRIWILSDLRVFCAYFVGENMRLCYFLRFFQVWEVTTPSSLPRLLDLSSHPMLAKEANVKVSSQLPAAGHTNPSHSAANACTAVFRGSQFEVGYFILYLDFLQCSWPKKSMARCLHWTHTHTNLILLPMCCCFRWQVNTFQATEASVCSQLLRLPCLLLFCSGKPV